MSKEKGRLHFRVSRPGGRNYCVIKTDCHFPGSSLLAKMTRTRCISSLSDSVIACTRFLRPAHRSFSSTLLHRVADDCTDNEVADIANKILGLNILQSARLAKLLQVPPAAC